MSEWTFLTNHATALLCLAQEPGMTLRQVGDRVGVTERAAHRIVSDLCAEGFIVRKRVGRRNRYRVRPDVPMRDPLLRDRPVGEMLAALRPELDGGASGAGAMTVSSAATPALAAEPTVTP